MAETQQGGNKVDRPKWCQVVVKQQPLSEKPMKSASLSTYFEVESGTFLSRESFLTSEQINCGGLEAHQMDKC
jgi:hypothetical protein